MYGKQVSRAAQLIPFAAEGIGSVFPEQIVVRRRQILFVVTGILPDLSGSVAGNTVHCVFVFRPVSGVLLFFVFAHN